MIFSNKQATIKNKIILTGISLHEGSDSQIVLSPANVNFGIKINNLQLSPLNIYGTKGMTKLGETNQIEHLCSALYALGIDNIDIKVNKNEMPILDGCSRYFIDEISKVGIKYYNEEKKIIRIKKKLLVEDNDSFIEFTPIESNLTEFECIVDFPYVGKQEYKWISNDIDDYINNISNAITFFWDRQIEEEYKLNRCKGVRKDINCMIYGKNDILNNNELAKHKLLDLIGDLSVINYRIPGKFRAYKCGHKINNKMINKIFELFSNQLDVKLPIEYFKFNTNINSELVKNKICDCIDTKKFINSEYINDFENNLADFIGCKHVVSTNSGTSALQLCLLSLELPRGSIVVIPNVTFWATYEAVKLSGYRVLVVDVNDDYQLDLNLLKEASKSFDIKAVLTVHLYGYISNDYLNLKRYCENKNIRLIEDGSHALGSKYNNEYILKNSYLSGVSLYPTKILGSNGNAGFVTTNDYHLAKTLKILRDNGRDGNRYEHYKIGGNFVMNSIQAIYSNEYLRNFDGTLKKLYFINKNYEEAFIDLNFIKYLKVNNCTPNGYMAILKCKNAEYIYKELKNRGICVSKIYSKTITDQPGFDKDDFTYLNGKGNELCNSVINLPIYYDLDPNEQKYIIEQVKELDKIKVMIVGLGRMGQFHLKELQKNNNFEMIGFIDPYLIEFNKFLKIKNYETAKDLGVELAIISSSTENHYECMINCLNNNINFLVEKPALTSIEQHNKFNILLNNKNLKCCVGLIERYNTVINKFNFNKKFIRINVERICRIPNNNDKSQILYDLIIHDIDLLQNIFNSELVINSYSDDNFTNTIKGNIDEIIIEIKVGYSNEKTKRTYFLETESESYELNLEDSKETLKLEHEDLVRLISGEDNKLCTLTESIKLTQKIDSIINLRIDRLTNTNI